MLDFIFARNSELVYRHIVQLILNEDISKITCQQILFEKGDSISGMKMESICFTKRFEPYLTEGNQRSGYKVYYTIRCLIVVRVSVSIQYSFKNNVLHDIWNNILSVRCWYPLTSTSHEHALYRYDN